MKQIQHQNWSWQEILRHMHWVYKSPPTAERRRHDVFLRMQEMYPGNYQIEEYYNIEMDTFRYKLVFDTPEEESFFMLKYSNK